MADWIDRHFNLPPTSTARRTKLSAQQRDWMVPAVVLVGVPGFLLLIVLGRDHFVGRHIDAPNRLNLHQQPNQRTADLLTNVPPIPSTRNARMDVGHVPPTVFITFKAKLRDETEFTPLPSEPSLVTDSNPSSPPMSEARAQALQRLMHSRRAGIALLDRDRASALLRLANAESTLASASRRLQDFERARIPNTNSRAVYEWQILHDDALSAMRTAVREAKRYQRLVDSFDERLEKAWRELQAAELEWNEGQPLEETGSALLTESAGSDE